MQALADLMSSSTEPEALALKHKSNVTYTALRTTVVDGSDCIVEMPVILFEQRDVIGGAGTTGLRTWEAALHLGTMLMQSLELQTLVAGRSVLELGAGSGFLSILCAKYLDARSVIATDGDAQVVETIKDNVFLNDAEANICCGTLRWGTYLEDTVVEQVIEDGTLDLVLGADVVRLCQVDQGEWVTDSIVDIRQSMYSSSGSVIEYDLSEVAKSDCFDIGHHS